MGLKAQALVAAGFTIQPKEFGLLTASTVAARASADAALAEMDRRVARLESFNRLSADRLAACLRQVIDTDPGKRAIIESFVSILQQLAPVLPIVRDFREKLVVHSVLMANAHAEIPGLRRTLENNAERARVLRSSLDDFLAEVPYPFDHTPPLDRLLEVIQAEETSSVVAEGPAFFNQLIRAQAATERIDQLAIRVFGSLAIIAATGERALSKREGVS